MLYFARWKIFLILTVCFLSVLFAVPGFISPEKKAQFPYSLLPNNQFNLGLDLKGGSHLLLQVDFNFYLKEQLTNLREELKKEFIEQRVRALPNVEGDKVTFRLNSENEKEIDQVRKIIKNLGYQITTDRSGDKFSLFFSDSQIIQMRKNLITQSIEIVRRRVDESGTKEPTIQAQGSDRILLQMPGVENPEQIKALLGKTAKMTFHFVDEDGTNNFAANGFTDLDSRKMQGEDGRVYLVKKEVILSGDLLVDANPTYYEGQPAVSFRFNPQGTRKFAEITRDNIGRIFAIVLDDQIVTAPRINSVIDQGMGVISGTFTVEEANKVALLLRAGALPAPLVIIEERTVGPSLGSDSIKYGTWSAMAGIIMVAIFMMLFYGFFGLVANIALLINITLLLSFLSIINATLTLPGIAGIVLTMGMSVDANVLIFERIKEELRHKKSPLAAIDAGFSQAFRTITDSNITTLIVALFLYIFGSGPVRGFAVTLSAGIIASMFSAILLTRMIIALWAKYKKPQTLSL